MFLKLGSGRDGAHCNRDSLEKNDSVNIWREDQQLYFSYACLPSSPTNGHFRVVKGLSAWPSLPASEKCQASSQSPRQSDDTLKVLQHGVFCSRYDYSKVTLLSLLSYQKGVAPRGSRLKKTWAQSQTLQ